MSILLSDDELRQVTGYAQPSRQLSELLRQGFFRARRSVLGPVILERSHYEAVCGGKMADKPRPKVHRPRMQPA